MSAFLLAFGAALLLAGTAWLSVPAALIVGGVLSIAAAVDLRPRGER